jgi:hypothetical protein
MPANNERGSRSSVETFVNWAEDSPSVSEYALAESFKGFVLTDVTSIHPDMLPEGWEVITVKLNNGTIYVRPER